MSIDEQVGQQQAGRPGQAFALLGRQAERAAIDRVLDAVRGGFSGTLILRGEPGVGKTTLLRYAIDAARDLRVSSIACAESEISMEFGGLHQLLLPFLPLLDELPPPQLGALRVAFGKQAGRPAERFLVGLAVLTLLSRAAQEHPLLCVVDDVHWLDPESRQVLAFVARRLDADRLGFIATSNELGAQQGDGGLPTIDVPGLPDADARELLSSVVGATLNAQVVDRILADTRNNPLALVELGTEYTANQLSGRAALPEPLPLGQRLRQHFLRQVRDLTPDAQMFTLLAATDPGGERGQLWSAAARAGIDPETASAETARAGLLQFPGSSVRFRYPLLRSAVYHGANAADRRRAHRVLAETGDSELSPWHLAAAAIVPDEELAAELQRAAERAAARGGYAAWAALLRRSADLTPDDGRRAEREVGLAEATLMAGDPAGAQTVLDVAQPRLTLAMPRGQAQLLAGAIRFAQGDAASAARILASAAQAFAHDDRLARDTMLGALEAAIWSGPVLTHDPAYTVEGTLPELIEAAVRAGEREVAATANETLSQRALAAGTPWGLGLRARCAALLAQGADAEDFYRESVSQLERCQMVVDLARTHLLYGQWLRRAKRRRDARTELRIAHDTFARMGADRFADLAAAELRATGEHARVRTPETVVDLTPQESRIADLTSAGASNGEIAAQLFISASTVDYHLRKVFRKLNVTSRTQLAGHLQSVHQA